MEKYVPLDVLLNWAKNTYLCENASMIRKVCYKQLVEHLNTIEMKEVDLDKQAEWIANGIMIAVQSAKLHTNVYNPDRKDYVHSHLMQAARRGIELGLKIAQKEK